MVAEQSKLADKKLHASKMRSAVSSKGWPQTGELVTLTPLSGPPAFLQARYWDNSYSHSIASTHELEPLPGLPRAGHRRGTVGAHAKDGQFTNE